MPIWEFAVILAVIIIVFSFIHLISKNKHPLKRAFISMLIGLFALAAVNLTSGFTGVSLPVSLLSILVSAAGGVPGVTLLLALNLFF